MSNNKNTAPEILGNFKSVKPRKSIKPEKAFTNVIEGNATPTEAENVVTHQQTEKKKKVLHHVHRHAIGKKDWKAYGWEFFMLFLAVFFGSLAEFRLEHVIENNREKQYITSMVQDLVEDTVKINAGIDFNLKKIAGIDSLLNTIYEMPYTDSSIKKMYYYNNNYVHFRASFIFTKRTISQLKNSGNLRLVRNIAASDSIIAYDESSEIIEKQMNLIYEHQIKTKEFENKIYDPRCNLKNNTKFTLLNNDEKLMMEYANWMNATDRILTLYIANLRNHKEQAINTLEFLKKTYHIQ